MRHRDGPLGQHCLFFLSGCVIRNAVPVPFQTFLRSPILNEAVTTPRTLCRLPRASLRYRPSFLLYLDFLLLSFVAELLLRCQPQNKKYFQYLPQSVWDTSSWAEATDLVVPREPRNRHQCLHTRHSRALLFVVYCIFFCILSWVVDDTSCADEDVITSFILSSGDHNRRTNDPNDADDLRRREAMAVSVRLAGFSLNSLPWIHTQSTSVQKRAYNTTVL